MRILSVDGGGYLGLASAAFLEGIEDHFGERCADRFDLFCGTSTGAIIALALANGMTASDVVTLYQKMGPKVFPVHHRPRWLATITGARHAKYPTEPLRTALEMAFRTATLGDLWARGKAAMVAAFCVTTGQPRVFKTDHSSQLTGHNGYRLADIALASAAAPTYFPLVELRDPKTGIPERFCDGGIFANTPALLGYAEAVHEFSVSPTDIQLLSISTPRTHLGERPGTPNGERPLDRGWLVWKDSFFDITIDGTSAVSTEALRRIMRRAGARHHRVTLPNHDGLAFDVATPEASTALRGIGAAHASQANQRQELYPFFCE